MGLYEQENSQITPNNPNPTMHVHVTVPKIHESIINAHILLFIIPIDSVITIYFFMFATP